MLSGAFLYLTAVMDWFRRYVLSWQLSDTLDGSFYLEALEAALGISRPEIFNTDQGVQFTATTITGPPGKRGSSLFPGPGTTVRFVRG